VAYGPTRVEQAAGDGEDLDGGTPASGVGWGGEGLQEWTRGSAELAGVAGEWRRRSGVQGQGKD
jgi:hypothetical protein